MSSPSGPTCPRCGSDAAEGSGFCGTCGAPLAPPAAQLVESAETLMCSTCGSEEPVDAAYCGNCGAAVAGAQAVQSPSVETSSPSAVVAAAAGAPLVPESVPGDGPAERPPAAQSDAPRRPRWLLAALLVALLGVGGAVAAVILTSGSSAKTASPPATVTVRVPAPTVAAAPVTTVAAAPVTVTAAPVTTVAVASAPASARLLPVESRAEMTDEIRTLLLAFHQDIVTHDDAAAWRLLSARKQHQELVKDGYAKWVAAQETLAPYLDPRGLQVRVLTADTASGVATVAVTGMKWSAPGARCTEWSGITWVKYEGGAWTYDPGHATTAARSRAWTSRYDELLGTQC